MNPLSLTTATGANAPSVLLLALPVAATEGLEPSSVPVGSAAFAEIFADSTSRLAAAAQAENVAPSGADTGKELPVVAGSDLPAEGEDAPAEPPAPQAAAILPLLADILPAPAPPAEGRPATPSTEPRATHAIAARFVEVRTAPPSPGVVPPLVAPTTPVIRALGGEEGAPASAAPGAPARIVGEMPARLARSHAIPGPSENPRQAGSLNSIHSPIPAAIPILVAIPPRLPVSGSAPTGARGSTLEPAVRGEIPANPAPCPAGSSPAAPPPAYALTVRIEPGVATLELLRAKPLPARASEPGATPEVSVMAGAQLSSDSKEEAANLLGEAMVYKKAGPPTIPGSLSAPVRNLADPNSAGPSLAAQAPAPVGQPGPSAPAVVPHTPQALALDSLIDRIVEARQSLAAGKVSLSISHHEFGAVGIRLEQAASGSLTSAALASSDPGFAPAVQAALADRAAAERNTGPGDQSGQARSDQPTQRSDGAAQGGQSHAQDPRAGGNPARGAPSTVHDGSARRGDAGNDAGSTGTDKAAADARGLYA